MKNLKFKSLTHLVFALTIVVIISSSCKKDGEINPDYVGTWAVIMPSIPTDTGYTSGFKDNMTFTKSGFTDLIQMPGESADKWIDYLSMKGSITVSGNMINVTITEFGISSFDVITGKPTGTIISYKEGSSTFNDILNNSGQAKTFNSEYSVSGNKMTLKTDNNEDGDYLDSDETTVYTRQ